MRKMKSVNLNDAILAEQILQENEILFQKITVALGCRREDVTQALREVLRFLFLVAHRDAGWLTPSHRVDLAWHEFILCTKAYREVCETHFGKYIDHHPGGSDELNRRRYQETLRCYERTFGSPDPAYWGDRTADLDCGACEAVLIP